MSGFLWDGPKLPNGLPAGGKVEIRGLPGSAPSILAAGAASAALYLIIQLMQRAIFRNGLHANPSLIDPGYAADSSALFWQYGVYFLSTLGLFIMYGFVLFRCWRGELNRRASVCALALPVLFNVLLIPGVPHLSEDIFSYMAHGYLGQLPSGNPFLLPASAAGNTALGPQLAAYGWRPETVVAISPYGVLWTRLEMAVMGVANDVPAALLLLKTLVVAASFGTAFLIWCFLGRMNPRFQMLGTLTYLWNPLVVVEFAGEGHNDSVLIVFVLAILVACSRMRPAVSVAALSLGILVKYLPAMFAPALLAYLWRTRRGTGGLTLRVSLGGLAGVGVAAMLYLPLWAGLDTFQGLLVRGQPLSSASPAGVVNWFVMRTPFASMSGPLTLALVTIPALGFMLWASNRVRDIAGLAPAFAQVSLAFVLVASPDYWPWYAGLPVALAAAASPDRMLLWLAVLLSLFGRLCAPLEMMFENGFIPFTIAKGLTTGLCTTLPLLVLATWRLQAWRGGIQATLRTSP
jgi:alpha-1,6-mannosyltransferase